MTDTFASYGYSINYLVRNLEGKQKSSDLFLVAFSLLIWLRILNNIMNVYQIVALR